MAEIDDLKRERDKYVKLAFCRADLLFEIDSDNHIVFVEGATDALFGASPIDLIATPFLNLITENTQDLTAALINGTKSDGRIDDAPVMLQGRGSLQLNALLAGYRAPEFDNHAFLAIKINQTQVLASPPKAPDPDVILDQNEFSEVAARNIQECKINGGTAQVSLIRLKRLKELVEQVGASDKRSLIRAIYDVLKRYSLGGHTAGQINEDSFGYAHTDSVDVEQVNSEIEEAALPFLPDGEEVESKSLTLDADGAEMTEDQVARALVHTMKQFCSENTRVPTRRLSDALDDMMSDTVDTVRFFKQVTTERDFDLVFMPICDLRMGRVHHFEALSRFRDPSETRNTFQLITLAENLDLITQFDYAVFEKVLEEIDRLIDAIPNLPSIAMNLSSLSIKNDMFVTQVLNRLSHDHRLANRIMFEMTESAEIDDLDKVNRVIQSFRERGFKFSLDDFGSGAASFDCLNALDVDIVKFDGPVIRRACASKRGHDLLSTMAKMCASSAIQTVAEMVEDKKVANQVFYCGIDFGQGWHFGKPTAEPLDFIDSFADIE